MDQSANRPTGLYVVGIGMMLFGLLGLCTQGLTVATTSQQRDQFRRINDAVEDADFSGMVELQEQMFFPNMASAGFGVLISLLLLVFGALTVARLGLALYTPAVLAAAVVVELMQLALSVYQQLQMAEVMNRFTSSFEAGSGGGFGADNFLSTAMGVGVCVIGGWALGKGAFFGASATYLRKPEIRQLFEAPPALGPRGD